MNEIIKFWESAYYTQAMTFVLAAVTIFIALKNWNRSGNLRSLFPFFTFYFLLQVITLYACLSYTRNDRNLLLIFRYFDFVTTVTEFLAFSYYAKGQIKNEHLKSIIRKAQIFFLLVASILFTVTIINYRITQATLQYTYSIEAAFLIVISFYYYYDLFKQQPSFQLLELPSFWVITGMSFFMVCTLPFSIFGQFIVKSNYRLYLQVFCIFNIFYCLLFLMIIKAYKCKPLLIK
jgi:hypothetical protein